MRVEPVQVLEDQQHGLLVSLRRAVVAPEHLEHPGAPSVGTQARWGSGSGSGTSRKSNSRPRSASRSGSRAEQPVGDLRPDLGGASRIVDAEVVAQEAQDRQQRDRLGVRDPGGPTHRHAEVDGMARQFLAQPRLLPAPASPTMPTTCAAPGLRVVQGRPQRGEFGIPPDQPRRPGRRRARRRRAPRGRAQPEHVHRIGSALHRRSARGRAVANVPPTSPAVCSVSRPSPAPRADSIRWARPTVCPTAVKALPDRPGDDLAGVQPDAHRQLDVLLTQRQGVLVRARHQPQRGVAGPAGVVLLRDRRAEQRHDAVAGELVDGAAEGLHRLAARPRTGPASPRSARRGRGVRPAPSS